MALLRAVLKFSLNFSYEEALTVYLMPVSFCFHWAVDYSWNDDRFIRREHRKRFCFYCDSECVLTKLELPFGHFTIFFRAINSPPPHPKSEGARTPMLPLASEHQRVLFYF